MYQTHTVRDSSQKTGAKKELPIPWKDCQEGKSLRGRVHMDRSPRTRDFGDYCWRPPVYSSARVLLMPSVLYPERYYEPCECLAPSASSLEINSADQYLSYLLKTTKHLQTPEYHREENPSKIPSGLMPMLPGDTRLKWKSVYFFFWCPSINRSK